jgi:hypothetical protein
MIYTKTCLDTFAFKIRAYSRGKITLNCESRLLFLFSQGFVFLNNYSGIKRNTNPREKKEHKSQHLSTALSIYHDTHYLLAVSYL